MQNVGGQAAEIFFLHENKGVVLPTDCAGIFGGKRFQVQNVTYDLLAARIAAHLLNDILLCVWRNKTDFRSRLRGRLLVIGVEQLILSRHHISLITGQQASSAKVKDGATIPDSKVIVQAMETTQRNNPANSHGSMSLTFAMQGRVRTTADGLSKHSENPL